MCQRFLILCILYFFVNLSSAQKVNTVVLDAGHGGRDVGALGKNSREKDIALSIVLKIREYIQKNLVDVKVVLTRDDDTFIELYQRAHIANSNKADLFISIHCNSIKSPSAYGVETFVMGLHKSGANLAVAKAENAAILLEDDYVEKYDGFDPNSDEGNIFFSMMQNAFLDRSLGFAGKIQHQLVDNLNLLNRGVKQAGFLVLYKTAMPGVLIETGFISNPKDEKFLLSDKGQDQIAKAVFNALCDYKEQIENKPIARIANDTTMVAKSNQVTIRSNKNETSVKETSIKETTVKEFPSKTSPVKDSPIKEIRTESNQPTGTEPSEIIFRVQFALYPDAKPITSKLFAGIDDVMMYFHGGSYKYTSGNYDTMEAALQGRKAMISKGYKDAFVVAFKGKNRITNEEAKKLTGKN